MALGDDLDDLGDATAPSTTSTSPRAIQNPRTIEVAERVGEGGPPSSATLWPLKCSHLKRSRIVVGLSRITEYRPPIRTLCFCLYCILLLF